MRIIYPALSYSDALELTGLPNLFNRREANNLFDEICANPAHSLHKLLPDICTSTYPLRNQRTFIAPRCKTERCKDSFIMSFVFRFRVVFIVNTVTIHSFIILDFSTFFAFVTLNVIQPLAGRFKQIKYLSFEKKMTTMFRIGANYYPVCSTKNTSRTQQFEDSTKI